MQRVSSVATDYNSIFSAAEPGKRSDLTSHPAGERLFHANTLTDYRKLDSFRPGASRPLSAHFGSTSEESRIAASEFGGG